MIYVLEWRTVSARTRGLFWCLFRELRSIEVNKHKINTRVSAETVRHESTYIILFLTRHNESINDDKNDDLYTSSRVSLAQLSFCWWRHYRLLMTSQLQDNCDVITWISISISLDIDFIHGDIHGRSCKKLFYIIFFFCIYAVSVAVSIYRKVCIFCVFRIMWNKLAYPQNYLHNKNLPIC